MLFLNGTAFTIGYARFLDSSTHKREGSAKVYVPIRVEGIELLAQLDTGAAWSILPSEVCEVLNLLNGTGPKVPVTTRKGRFEGRLERLCVTLVAAEGVSLDVDATILVLPDWDDDAFLGWSGLLERVRTALDPGQYTNYFYFGPVAA
ncbi:MAG TPA: hypothetical protein VE974_14265 [Thermoanaerobaculia bacterium]|nr:hypothetical protein [Thermoanaerobaculia bacterium]